MRLLSLLLSCLLLAGLSEAIPLPECPKGQVFECRNPGQESGCKCYASLSKARAAPATRSRLCPPGQHAEMINWLIQCVDGAAEYDG
ncbi:hypothetical protein PENTCL1PPCAC_9176 [Pristionchus entomophagus]|uniref:Thyroglobulin type-1 domain-containing protein n=1 Tax=Pristionchus entomophagus TaxID=358040 RepID=A0AAV5SV03_9BILA|nr:hypothetical protein PENTCL1PPCAC_9176 [Pristionchus entomophagus]